MRSEPNASGLGIEGITQGNAIEKGGGMKKQVALAIAIFGHLGLFLFVDSLFEGSSKWKMWAFYGSSMLSIAVWAAYVVNDDWDGGAA